MSFNIFDFPRNSDITVGYVDPSLGYVTGVSICDANEYARKNPGTTFVFETRDGIRYLNINGVNQLTPKDLASSADTCTGIQVEGEADPPSSIFLGGGGVGAAGNPVFGKDGSLLAVDLISGGFGYQYPPLVEVRDETGLGVGAVTRAILVGDPDYSDCKFVDTFEVFDQEDDFEEYLICDPTDAGFGIRYDAEGKPIGSWNPSLYANLSKDPIAREIQKYQDFLQQLSTPWWTTRKENPLRVTSGSRTTRIKHDVQHPNARGIKSMIGFDYSAGTADAQGRGGDKYFGYGVDYPNAKAIGFLDSDIRYYLENDFKGLIGPKMQELLNDPNWGKLPERGGGWSDFMNSYAISPVPPSNAPGSDFAGQEFTMEWEENFPYDGEYVFRAQADNIGRYYLDNEKLIETVQFRQDQTPKVVKKNVKAGVHRIRIDIYNKPQYEKVVKNTTPPPPSPQSTSTTREEWVKVDDVYVPPVSGRGGTSIPKNASFHKYNEGTYYKGKRIRSGGDWNDTNPNNNYIEWDSNTRLTLGKYHGSRFGIAVWNKKTITETQAAPPPPPAQTTRNNSKSSTTSTESQVRKIFNTVDYIGKADRKLWRLDPRAGRDAGFINQYGVLPFNPNSDRAQSDDFSGTHVIRWEYVDFPVDGNYNIEIMVDDNVTLYIGNRDGGGAKAIGNGLRSVDQGGDEVIIRKVGYSSPGRSTGKSLETRFFKAGKYRIRAELEQIKGRPLSGGNPMALAINIESSIIEESVVSARSWNQNPMGASLTIDAPLPPIPQEPIPQQEGRCPNNPIWTTRFPGGKEKWWPVKFQNAPGLPSWSRFMNRYAISPIPPLSKPGSDGGGIVYRNEWNVDIPYDGFYAFKSTVDNAGRILIDGKPIMQANYIPTTLENTRGGSGSERRSGISAIGSDGIIYNWRENNPRAKKIFLSKGLHKIEIEVENGKTNTYEKINKKIFSTKDWLSPSNNNNGIKSMVGFDYSPGSADAQGRGGNQYFGYGVDYPNAKAQGFSDADIRYYLENDFPGLIGEDMKARLQDPNWGKIPTKNVSGIVYEGPTPIANYRGDFISPVFQNVNAKPNEEIQGKTWIFRWSNVDFPVDGQYTLESEADDQLIVRIDGNEVGVSKVFEGRRKTTFNATKGKRTVELELSNIRIPDTGFEQNPTVGFAQITVPVDVATGVGQPWSTNPVGISALLIPPPCPKKVTGKGVVCRVIVDDPGNGFPAAQGPGYPAALRLRSIEVENPGINYNCGVDQIQITPSNGAQLSYECDTFGRITKVNVLNPGLGFTQYPQIIIPSDTGVNASFRPQFEIVRDPIVVDPEIIIQVTDLVGLKQTGYVDGRPYYGAVFYRDGVRYAGFYQTPGELVQVYDTLQESIDGVVVTPPSAIQRQGTDITSNDPRLNIPGTPDEII